MQKKRTKKRKKKHVAMKKAFGMYVVFILISSVLCCKIPLKTMGEKVSLFVGIAGTLASLYSIFGSIKDEERSKEENRKSNRFLIELKKNLNFVLLDTGRIRKNMDLYLNEHMRSNVSDSKPKAGEKPKEVWEEPNDEVKPS